jgi:hypothetical protein
MLFRKFKIINKSNTAIEEMYVTMWNDPDLGDATDDFVGCDTVLSMTFVIMQILPMQFMAASLQRLGLTSSRDQLLMVNPPIQQYLTVNM